MQQRYDGWTNQRGVVQKEESMLYWPTVNKSLILSSRIRKWKSFFFYGNKRDNSSVVVVGIGRPNSWPTHKTRKQLIQILHVLKKWTHPPNYYIYFSSVTVFFQLVLPFLIITLDVHSSLELTFHPVPTCSKAMRYRLHSLHFNWLCQPLPSNHPSQAKRS